MADNNDHVSPFLKETAAQNGRVDTDALPKVLVSEPTSPLESIPSANGEMEKNISVVKDESKTPEGKRCVVMKFLKLYCQRK